jgi:hypothetical protein
MILEVTVDNPISESPEEVCLEGPVNGNAAGVYREVGPRGTEILKIVGECPDFEYAHIRQKHLTVTLKNPDIESIRHLKQALCKALKEA